MRQELRRGQDGTHCGDASGSSVRETQGINSSVPWVGLLVGYTVSGFSLTVFGYFARML